MSVKQEPDTVTEDLTEPEPGCTDRNVKTKHHGAPQVKTEDCFEEENSGLPNINQSQAHCLKLTKTEVDDVVNAVDGPSGLEDFCGYTDLLQKKVTSDLLDCLHKSNSLVTDFHPKCQYMLHPHDKEVHEHRTQTIVKSEDTENREFFVSQDVQNVDEYLSSSDEVFKSQQIKLYECGTCPYSSNYLFDLHKHNISHKMENVYICDLCQASYQYFLDLRYHLTSHVTGTESLSHLSVVIDQCTDKIQNFEDLNYVNKDMLMQNHADNIRTHGLEKSSDKCSLEQDVVLPKKRHVDNKQYSFDILLQNKCINNDFILNHSASDLNNAAGRMERGQETENELHREAVTLHFIDNALKRHNSDPWIHERTHASKKPYFCDKCDYKCAKPSRLYQHKKKHTGEKPYSCDQCDYKCAQLSNLNRHKKKHTGEKPYSCDLCDYKCAYLSKLTCHKKSHTGEKPYSCRLCDFRSASMYNCQIHERTHTGEKPYSCDQCDYKSAGSSNLYQHKRKHTSEKPLYSCDQCGYKCAQPSHLYQHKRNHTSEKPSYSCDKCDYKCARPSKLYQHKKKHTGEKPYSCDQCDYKCAQLSNLKRHKRRHTGEKPHSCPLCNYRCADSCDLRRHKKKHKQ